jgi:phage-related minor tail protein
MEGAMYKFTDKQLKELQMSLTASQGKANYQRVMAVWLRAKCQMDAQTVADAIGRDRQKSFSDITR